MSKLIWIGLGAPLAMVLMLTIIRLVQYDTGFGPVALTAAGVYILLAAAVGAWLKARGFATPRAPGYAFWSLAIFGLTMTLRGLGLVRGTGALLAMAIGTGSLVAAAFGSLRDKRKPD